MKSITRRGTFSVLGAFAIGTLPFSLALGSTSCAGLNVAEVESKANSILALASNISTWAADAWSFLAGAATPGETQAYTDSQNSLKAAIATFADLVAAFAAGASQNWPVAIASLVAAADVVIGEIQSLTKTASVSANQARVSLVTPALIGRVAQLEKAQNTMHRYSAAP